MKKIRFYKESDNRWYVDLPDWTGSKADLEMVFGADTMLEYMSEGNNEVLTYISEEEFENSDILELIRLATELGNGAYYKLNKYRGIDIGLELWLCDVTLFVFDNKFPNKIYISAVNNN